MRLPKQVLIIPYRIINEKVEYGIFKRKNRPIWQWISGGVEDFDKDSISYAEEYSFAVNINDEKIKSSEEHSEYKWTSYEDAISLLKYDSNKNALWELNEKIRRHLIK